MDKYRVRVPIVGYVDVDVLCSDEKTAIEFGKELWSQHLSPRPDVTDLSAFSLQQVRDFCLVASERAESFYTVHGHTYEDHIYTLGIAEEEDKE